MDYSGLTAPRKAKAEAEVQAKAAAAQAEEAVRLVAEEAAASPAEDTGQTEPDTGVPAAHPADEQTTEADVAY